MTRTLLLGGFPDTKFRTITMSEPGGPCVIPGYIGIDNVPFFFRSIAQMSEIHRLPRPFSYGCIGLSLLAAAPLIAAEFYVATDGNDANAGSLDLPFASVQRAQQAAAPGDTVFVRGGTYPMTETQIAQRRGMWAYVTALDKSGSEGKPIRYWAYRDELPVFDFTSVKPAGCRVTAFRVTGSWLHLKGLTATGVQVTITRHTQSICFDNHRMKNNLGFNARTEVSNLNAAASDVAGNYFNLPVTVEEKDFASLDAAELTKPRQANGDLPEIAFLHLAPGSGLIDQGVAVGLPFAGKAPELGAFEFGAVGKKERSSSARP